MNNYLLEIGTEELPVEFTYSVIPELSDKTKDLLNQNHMTYGSVQVFTTPRRIVLFIEDIAEKQQIKSSKVRGPQKNIAIDSNGNWTKAAIGFANRFNKDVHSLIYELVDGIEYIFIETEEGGSPSTQVLSEKLEKIVLSVSGKRFMKWGTGNNKFPRPIRWVLSLYNHTLVPLSIADVQASNYTYGHRQLANYRLEVQNTEHFFDLLEKNYVIVDQQKRKAIITSQLETLSTHGHHVKKDEELLNSVTQLVEWPIAMIGSFDNKFLQIPDDVTVTVMAHHQKYFPLFDHQGKLVNQFITISNVLKNREQSVVTGNQKVIKARFNDAMFFFQEDRKKTLESYIDNLKGITFLKGLGTLYDKTRRIQTLAGFLAQTLNSTDEEIKQIQRAAYLSKADLSTNLVKEMTELQGIIGFHYALLDKEPESVAYSIKDHYYPRCQGDVLPSTYGGQILCLADKLDTLVSIFAIGKQPTGTADPFGLRRAAIGILNIIIEKQLPIQLLLSLEKAYQNLIDFPQLEPQQTVINHVKDFVFQRLKTILEEKGYRYDIVEAYIHRFTSKYTLNDALASMSLYTAMIQEPHFNTLHESANRIKKIIKEHTGENILPDLLIEQAEIDLYGAIKSLDGRQSTGETLLQELQQVVIPIQHFFDNVLVMCDNEELKINRLNLLVLCDKKFTEFADFSKIVS